MKKTKLYLKRQIPTVLTFIGASGVVATAIMTAKATPKAIRVIEKATNDKGGYLTNLEVILNAGPVYIPAILTGVGTVACIFGANMLNKRNQASLVSAYGLLSQSYNEYRQAATKVYGEDANEKIYAEMAKDVYVHADGHSVYDKTLETDGDKVLCYDLYSKRYFESSIAAVVNAQYHVNRNLTLRGDSTINDFYEFLGIDSIHGGDDIGWDLFELHAGGIQWLDFENVISKTDDGMECCIISSVWAPETLICE